MEVRPDSQETADLLRGIDQGQPAFDQLFARHRNLLRHVINMRFDPNLRSRVDPSDVVQETQLEAFRRMPDFLRRRPMPFRLWLRKMAHERLIMATREHLVRQRRTVSRELPLPDQSSVTLAKQLLANEKSPSQHATEDELAVHVRWAIAQLSEPDREMLLMRIYEGLSYDEIACILEIEPAAARKRNGRALVRLHKLLTENGLSESQL